MWRGAIFFACSILPAAAFQLAPHRGTAVFPKVPTSELLASASETAAVLPDLSQSEFPPLRDEPYDLVVLGSGPGGEATAVQAARLGASVAVVEVKKAFGGPTGLTSKAVREASIQINQAVKNVGGDKRGQTRELWKRLFPALREEAEILQAAETRNRLDKNLIDLYIGKAEILPNSKRAGGEPGKIAVRVCRPSGCVDIPADHVCIATGSRPNRPQNLASGAQLPFHKGVVVDATEMGTIPELPEACAIVGGGVIAVEYATVLATLGVEVFLLCKDEDFIPFLAEELRMELRQRMARNHVQFVSSPIKSIDIDAGEDVAHVQLGEEADGQQRHLRVDKVLYIGGRDANSEDMGCEDAGVDTALHGRIKVDSSFRTSNPLVFAVGDVTGPPGLASSAQMGGRAVAMYLFKNKMQRLRQYILEASKELEDVVDDPFFAAEAESPAGAHRTSEQLQRETAESIFEADTGPPLTLWTIPEISSVGLTEEKAFKKGMRKASHGGSMVTGYAYFEDVARGRLKGGDTSGFLKLVARAEGPTHHVIVGVQVIGEGANELIQMGSILIHGRTTLEEVSNTAFAAVTLSALYQVAADDGLCNSPYFLQRHPMRTQAYDGI
eukprot:g8277.t1